MHQNVIAICIDNLFKEIKKKTFEAFFCKCLEGIGTVKHIQELILVLLLNQVMRSLESKKLFSHSKVKILC